MIKRFKNIFRHRHKWKDTLFNRYSTAVEQRCKCGEYRHHTFKDLKNLDSEPRWREGRHPQRRVVWESAKEMNKKWLDRMEGARNEA